MYFIIYLNPHFLISLSFIFFIAFFLLISALSSSLSISIECLSNNSFSLIHCLFYFTTDYFSFASAIFLLVWSIYRFSYLIPSSSSHFDWSSISIFPPLAIFFQYFTSVIAFNFVEECRMFLVGPSIRFLIIFM